MNTYAPVCIGLRLDEKDGAAQLLGNKNPLGSINQLSGFNSLMSLDEMNCKVELRYKVLVCSLTYLREGLSKFEE